MGRTRVIAGVEGRALGRLPWQQRNAYLIPLAAGLVASLVAPMTGSPRAVWGLAGVVGGVLWQLAYRRDLVDRLTFPVALLTVSGVLALVPDVTFETADGGALLWVGVLVGLVWTEHYLRRRG
ncbi:hypothetical protein GUY44_08160 [Pimelobacter simplex]|uniref:hypothetical protein n=1 Tax=Nocardioides simplex TaxID=2045 RepID=UPI000536212F|nr:hypothetical protein [Pimelobacter simplex]MCG8150449.1 hypothetical protein [Pimelobacter simplex]